MEISLAEMEISLAEGGKAFLEKAIAGGKAVLGICPGTRLLADVLKARYSEMTIKR